MWTESKLTDIFSVERNWSFFILFKNDFNEYLAKYTKIQILPAMQWSQYWELRWIWYLWIFKGNGLKRRPWKHTLVDCNEIRICWSYLKSKILRKFLQGVKENWKSCCFNCWQCDSEINMHIIIIQGNVPAIAWKWFLYMTEQEICMRRLNCQIIISFSILTVEKLNLL